MKLTSDNKYKWIMTTQHTTRRLQPHKHYTKSSDDIEFIGHINEPLGMFNIPQLTRGTGLYRVSHDSPAHGRLLATVRANRPSRKSSFRVNHLELEARGFVELTDLLNSMRLIHDVLCMWRRYRQGAVLVRVHVTACAWSRDLTSLFQKTRFSIPCVSERKKLSSLLECA